MNDTHNSDPTLRSRPCWTLQILTGLKYDSADVWKGGRLYGPERGREGVPKATLIGPDLLEIKVTIRNRQQDCKLVAGKIRKRGSGAAPNMRCNRQSELNATWRWRQTSVRGSRLFLPDGLHRLFGAQSVPPKQTVNEVFAVAEFTCAGVKAR